MWLRADGNVITNAFISPSSMGTEESHSAVIEELYVEEWWVLGLLFLLLLSTSIMCVSIRLSSLKALSISPVTLGGWSEGLKAKEEDGPGLALLAGWFQLLRFLA